MGTFVKVARMDEIPAGQGKKVEAGGKQVALFNVDGQCYAIDDTCTHVGGSLSEGSIAGKEVRCPWHGATFDVTSGEVLGPPAAAGVSCYAVRVADGDIEIEV